MSVSNQASDAFMPRASMLCAIEEGEAGKGLARTLTLMPPLMPPRASGIANAAPLGNLGFGMTTGEITTRQSTKSTVQNA